MSQSMATNIILMFVVIKYEDETKWKAFANIRQYALVITTNKSKKLTHFFVSHNSIYLFFVYPYTT